MSVGICNNQPASTVTPSTMAKTAEPAARQVGHDIERSVALTSV